MWITIPKCFGKLTRNHIELGKKTLTEDHTWSTMSLHKPGNGNLLQVFCQPKIQKKAFFWTLKHSKTNLQAYFSVAYTLHLWLLLIFHVRQHTSSDSQRWGQKPGSAQVRALLPYWMWSRLWQPAAYRHSWWWITCDLNRKDLQVFCKFIQGAQHGCSLPQLCNWL